MALPAQENGFVTFGCMNPLGKVNRPRLELWAESPSVASATRGWCFTRPPAVTGEAIRALFREGGIAPDRIEFVAKAPQPEHFRRYHDLDLSLDPFPYNGHTSTLDSLWMGVPVITLAGRTAVGRGGVSILSNLGLPELIARTPEQYVEIAVRMATDLDRLAAASERLAGADADFAAHGRRQDYAAAVEGRCGGCGRTGAAYKSFEPTIRIMTNPRWCADSSGHRQLTMDLRPRSTSRRGLARFECGDLVKSSFLPGQLVLSRFENMIWLRVVNLGATGVGGDCGRRADRRLDRPGGAGEGSERTSHRHRPQCWRGCAMR